MLQLREEIEQLDGQLVDKQKLSEQLKQQVTDTENEMLKQKKALQMVQKEKQDLDDKLQTLKFNCNKVE